MQIETLTTLVFGCGIAHIILTLGSLIIPLGASVPISKATRACEVLQPDKGRYAKQNHTIDVYYTASSHDGAPDGLSFYSRNCFFGVLCNSIGA